MKEAYIIDGIRTPIGKFKGSLSSIRTDDLGALVIKTVVERNENIPKEAYDDVEDLRYESRVPSTAVAICVMLWTISLAVFGLCLLALFVCTRRVARCTKAHDPYGENQNTMDGNQDKQDP